MRFSRALPSLGAAALVLFSSPVRALTVEYCSSENTADPDTLRTPLALRLWTQLPVLTVLETSTFQSNGLCQEQCNADYAFGVVLWKDCWCTNYIPAEQNSVSDCDSTCPGYPDDLCGNRSKNLYGYIAMSNVKPSGTSSATATGSATSTASSGSTTQTTPSNSDPSSSTGQNTAPTVSVQTVAGQPVTITIGNPSSAESTGASASTSSKPSSLSGGAIAGIVIGTLVGVGALAALGLWFFFFGRRRNEESEKSPTPESRYDPSVMGGGSENRRQSKGSQMSFMPNFMNQQQKSPTSPNDFLSPNKGFTDNRMKKDAALYPNGSRHSAVSLRDNEDYSRPVLRLTNPD
ncbi:hypothetical protein BGW36DRAFT_104653 [Talaromyces proteolyticus]|uniref:WSC domain-containing protein n=1 Tax=Talaromyces proteolyticus TaxID=1131652 RepID=A0AAD4Q3G3_9EURO|nr:uncharacterized protein BGW36DRAFT_104653 [Talaromyces proteolyticus]KAH8701751.1 hypothetical protein BGW36DRAFT_104653 [Talaromyces proteolyticus]